MRRGVSRSPTGPCSACWSSWCWWSSSSGPTSASGRCPWRPGRALPRRRHHRRCLRPVRLRGHPGHRDRSADHPRLLALRHRRRLRQGAREHQGSAARPADLPRGRQPGGQPDAGAVHQHLDRRAAPGGRDPLRQRGDARLGGAEGPRARAVRRHGGRPLLLGVHRHPAARAAKELRARGQGRRRPRVGSHSARVDPFATCRPSPRTCRCTTSRRRRRAGPTTPPHRAATPARPAGRRPLHRRGAAGVPAGLSVGLGQAGTAGAQAPVPARKQ